MIHSASVVERLDRDIEEVTSTARRANQVANATTRDLLKWLLPNPESAMAAAYASRWRTYKNVEKFTATFFDLLLRTDAWRRATAKKRQLENAVEQEWRMKEKKVKSFIDSLNYEDLLPLFLDYKLKDLDKVIQIWSGKYAESLKTGPYKRGKYKILEYFLKQ